LTSIHSGRWLTAASDRCRALHIERRLSAGLIAVAAGACRPRPAGRELDPIAWKLLFVDFWPDLRRPDPADPHRIFRCAACEGIKRTTAAIVCASYDHRSCPFRGRRPDNGHPDGGSPIALRVGTASTPRQLPPKPARPARPSWRRPALVTASDSSHRGSLDPRTNARTPSIRRPV
jgi:hypothetical protein